ncbi:unnamed protein product [Mytilus coruscus]|uniref:Uncharacterized protein n=1 Tax=Mytilus coruscus TaxID=42192 RepID=A0A6J8BS80_MYTCO|nr:unnamed protein product [Mytilus coruscus]
MFYISKWQTFNQDLTKLHEITSQTTVNGENIDIRETNKILAQKLDSILQNSNCHLSKHHHVNEHNNTNEVEKCQKCRKICRTRAVYCMDKHWVHFKFERLSETEIKQLEKQDNSTYEYLITAVSVQTQNNNNIIGRAPNTKTSYNNAAEQNSISTDNEHAQQEIPIKLK